MTEPRTTLRGRRATAGTSGGPRLKFGFKQGQVCPMVWRWFQGEQDLQMAPAITHKEELVEWYRLFLAQHPGEVPTPQDVEHHAEIASMLIAHRAAQAAAPRRPRGRARASPAT